MENRPENTKKMIIPDFLKKDKSNTEQFITKTEQQISAEVANRFSRKMNEQEKTIIELNNQIDYQNNLRKENMELKNKIDRLIRENNLLKIYKEKYISLAILISNPVIDIESKTK